MAAKIRRADELLPLSPPVLYVLLAVADTQRHGYAIMQEVERRTSGEIRLLPGSLYSTIKRMVAQGLIEELDEPPDAEDDDERRRYYGITEHGRAVAAAEMQRLSTLIDFAKAKRILQTRPSDALNVQR